MSDPLRPGWQTTEAWLTLLGVVMSALVAFHVTSSADAASLTDSISKIITSLFAIIASASMVIHYVEGRVALKHQAADAALPADEPGQPAVPPLP